MRCRPLGLGMGREVRYLDLGTREARNVTLQFIHLERGDLVSKEDDKEKDIPGP